MSDPAPPLWLSSGGCYVGPVGHWHEVRIPQGVTYQCCLLVSYGNSIAGTLPGHTSRAVCACRPYRRWDGACLGVFSVIPQDSLQAVPHASHSQMKGQSLLRVAAVFSCLGSQAEASAPPKYLQFNISGFLTPLPSARRGLGREQAPSRRYRI